MAVITLILRYIQLPQESVEAYANHLKAQCRQAGCNLQKHEEVQYDIAWPGHSNFVKNNVGPMTPACGRFNILDESFHHPMGSEVTHVDNMKPQQQQQWQQQQQRQREPTDSSSTGGKQCYRPSISEPADTTGGKPGQSDSN
jgi:hypothetical protein